MQATTAPLFFYARGFESVFAKNDFNILLKHCYWNHVIELFLDFEPRSTKVYLLFSVKQKKLNTFLEENLYTKQIHLSKSPMAAPVFFIKKKNSSLWLVQDY